MKSIMCTLTLTTSCQMINSLQGALTREASEVLKMRAEGKLQSGEQRRGRGEQKGDRR